MNSTDIARAAQLHQEVQQIGQALAHLEAGGTVLNLTIAPPAPANTAGPLMVTPAVPVVMPAPSFSAAMLAGLRKTLEGRQHEIEDQLGELGIVS